MSEKIKVIKLTDIEIRYIKKTSLYYKRILKNKIVYYIKYCGYQLHFDIDDTNKI